jgi:cytochrome b6-f complex iron-sulfur subunit
MLLVCRPGLAPADFHRLEGHLAPIVHDLRWARRAGRLVLLFEVAPEGEAALAKLETDPAVDYLLRSPSPGEIARILSRRDLLDLAVGSTTVMAAAAVLGPLGLYLAAPGSERSTRAEVALGSAESIPVGGARTRVIDGEEYVIVRRSETSFHALSATCTHSRVCRVDWDPERRQLVCPCHRGVFDLFGNVVSGPPPRPLTRREVVVRNGEVYVKRGER